MRVGKSFSNTSAKEAEVNVSDIKFFGNGDSWQLICKAWSEEEDWMKSTKAMEIPGVGCLVQVTTQMEDEIAEAITFAPGVKIKAEKDSDGKVTSRQLVAMNE